MANIVIREVDATTAGMSANPENIVYIPGFSTAVYPIKGDTTTENAQGAKPFEPKLCTSITEFETYFGKDIPPFDTNQSVPEGFSANAKYHYEVMFNENDSDPSYIMAKELINAGIPVLYERINVKSTPEIDPDTGDIKSTDISVSNMYDVLSGGSYSVDTPPGVLYHDIFENLKDKGEYDIKYISTGGYPSFEYTKDTYDVDTNVTTSTTGKPDEFGVKVNNNILLNSQLITKPAAGDSITYTFTYNKPEDDAEGTWTIEGNDDPQRLADYGITTKGVPNNNDTIEITISTSKAGSIIASRMIDCASSRGDCVALIDHTNNSERPLNPADNRSVYYAISTPDDDNLYFIGDTYATMFTPWATYDCVKSGISLALPGSFGYLMALSKSIKTNPNWLAIAGASRGIIPNFVALNTDEKFTNAIADSYQPRDGVAINPITNIKPYGYIIWGNRTLFNNSTNGNLIASSFLNTRNMVSEIKKVAYKAAKRCMFEQNSDVLWVTFQSMITPTLNKMTTSYGLSKYTLTRHKVAEKAKLVCTITIVPMYAVEDFDITIRMEDEDITIA